MNIELLPTSLAAAIDWWDVAEFVYLHLEQELYALAGVIIALSSLQYGRKRLRQRDWVISLLIAAVGVVLLTFAFYHITTPGAVIELYFMHFPTINYITGLVIIAGSTFLYRIDLLEARIWVLFIGVAVFMLMFPTYLLTLE